MNFRSGFVVCVLATFIIVPLAVCKGGIPRRTKIYISPPLLRRNPLKDRLSHFHSTDSEKVAKSVEETDEEEEASSDLERPSRIHALGKPLPFQLVPPSPMAFAHSNGNRGGLKVDENRHRQNEDLLEGPEMMEHLADLFAILDHMIENVKMRNEIRQRYKAFIRGEDFKN